MENLPKQKLTPVLSNLRAIVFAVGFLFLLAFGSYNAMVFRNQMVGTADTGNIGNDMVSTWDRRMRKMLPDLPDHGVVGYLADWDIPDYTYGHTDQTVEFLLSQYALAPLTLQRGADYPVIVGNFSDTGDPEKIPGVLELFNLRILKEHTNEIFILEGNK
ncbi:MAG: hypothetical protein AB9891_18000 [Anaerolineaceae bacterium]